MLPFQWNALRTGDRVLVHDDNDTALTLTEGVVEFVQTRARSHNDLAIRLAATPPRVVRPRRHAVHMAPLDPWFDCWRCELIASRSGNPMTARIAA